MACLGSSERQSLRPAGRASLACRGFGAPEPEAGWGFVGVQEVVSASELEAGRRDVVGVPGFVGVLGFVSAPESEPGR